MTAKSPARELRALSVVVTSQASPVGKVPSAATPRSMSAIASSAVAPASTMAGRIPSVVKGAVDSDR